MRLTKHTDYALRILIYLGLRDGELIRLADVAASYSISHNHLMKIAQRLGALGYIDTVQGRGGGITLARAPATIGVGDVVRDFEDDLALVECFEPDGACRIEGSCVLRHALDDALRAFLATLDRYTLADLLAPGQRLSRFLGLDSTSSARTTRAATPAG